MSLPLHTLLVPRDFGRHDPKSLIISNEEMLPAWAAHCRHREARIFPETETGYAEIKKEVERGRGYVLIDGRIPLDPNGTKSGKS